MEARFTNGSSVNRVWNDKSTEFLAAFQYEQDAGDFAQSKLAQDASRKMFDSSYIVSNTYTGAIIIFRHAVASPDQKHK